MMKLGPEGEKLIKDGEGLVLYAYDDANPSKPFLKGKPKGELTIGYGHTSAAGAPKVVPGMKITKAEAEKIFKTDIKKYVDDVNRLVTREVTQNQFDALVSFHYNTGALGKSTLLKRVNAGQFDQVPAEFMKWVNDNGRMVPGLVNRRRAEVAVWRGIEDGSIAPAKQAVEPPKPEKPITKSKIATASAGIGIAGGLEVANQFTSAVSTASATHDSVGILTVLLRSPTFWIALVILALAGAIWYWRSQMLQETGA
jgi:lysozyme